MDNIKEAVDKVFEENGYVSKNAIHTIKCENSSVIVVTLVQWDWSNDQKRKKLQKAIKEKLRMATIVV